MVCVNFTLLMTFRADIRAFDFSGLDSLAAKYLSGSDAFRETPNLDHLVIIIILAYAAFPSGIVFAAIIIFRLSSLTTF